MKVWKLLGRTVYMSRIYKALAYFASFHKLQIKIISLTKRFSIWPKLL